MVVLRGGFTTTESDTFQTSPTLRCTLGCPRRGAYWAPCHLSAGRHPSLSLPQWFIRMAISAGGESATCLFEICAAILTAGTVVDLSFGATRSCALCIDNQASLSALTKGSASPELGTVLVGSFAAIAARIPVQWWPGYVHTAPNDADAPSRDCNARDEHRRPLNLGPIQRPFGEIPHSRVSLHRASTRI